MRINSRRKGARVELEARDLLRSWGYIVERNARNGKSAADLDLSQDPHLRLIHLEVKGDRSIGLCNAALLKAMEQAERDCGGRPCAVLFKLHRGPWVLAMRDAIGSAAIRFYAGEGVRAGIIELFGRAA